MRIFLQEPRQPRNIQCRVRPAPNARPIRRPMMTTREVFDSHISHQLDRNLDAILTYYAPDAIVVGPDGIGSGHDHIRASYERVLPLIGSLDLTSVQVQDEVVYVTFRAQSDGRDDLVGTDIFVIRDGLIQIHTFYAITESPALDGS